MNTILVDQALHDETTVELIYPLVTGKERLALWQDACGIFEGREEEILAELTQEQSSTL